MDYSPVHVQALFRPQSPAPRPSTPTRGFGRLRSLSSLSQASIAGKWNNLRQSPLASEVTPDNVNVDVMASAASNNESLTSSSMSGSGLGSGMGLDVNKLRKMRSTQSLVMEDQEFSTNPDPRSRAGTPRNVSGSGSTVPSQHPDLDDEVATLSAKLVSALNHQTNLDDTLSVARTELEEERNKVSELEQVVAQQNATLAGDVWVRRSWVEEEKSELARQAVEERRCRGEAEKEKRRIEQELENLTTALFEEANAMVIKAKEEAKKEHDALQRKNDCLKSQLADNEGLLRSQQEQLTELKVVMEQITSDRDDHSGGTVPSSPAMSKFDSQDLNHDGRLGVEPLSHSQQQQQHQHHHHHHQPHSGVSEPCSPTYPTSLTQLLQPVLRIDLVSYNDFLALVRTSKTPQRVSSGSTYSGIMANLTGGSAASTSAGVPSNTSTTSLSATTTSSTGTTAASSPQTPITPNSLSGAPLLPPLKETKFFKRALVEDVEPTLRLDIAPGLSWLARRSVLTAVTEGTLVVEPVLLNTTFALISKPQNYPCALCGEARKIAPHFRNHRFRTSENESAQRYPLCKYCLGRVRSTCDFLGFLRIVKDGLWRCDDSEGERAAWEESVRLREQMFWSRIGGGVVPAVGLERGMTSGSVGEKSPRVSDELVGHGHDDSTVSSRKAGKDNEERRGIIMLSPPPPEDDDDEDEDDDDDKEEGAKVNTSDVTVTENKENKEDQGQPRFILEPVASSRLSAKSLKLERSTTTKKEEPKRLSLTIPGSS